MTNSNDPPTSVLLVRHGQSTWNAERRWQGQENPPLSEEGKSQASRAARKLGAVDVIVSSPLERALETASIISRSVGTGPVIVADEFIERHSGEWQGLTREQIDASWPGWNQSGVRPPGWESDELVAERVRAGFAILEAEFGGLTILLVAHSGIIRNLERTHCRPERRVPNLHGVVVTVSDGSTSLGSDVALIEA